MARCAWITEEVINAVKEALDKLSDADIAIEDIYNSIQYEDAETDEEEVAIDAIKEELSWDISGEIGVLMSRLEELFDVTL